MYRRKTLGYSLFDETIWQRGKSIFFMKLVILNDILSLNKAFRYVYTKGHPCTPPHPKGILSTVRRLLPLTMALLCLPLLTGCFDDLFGGIVELGCPYADKLNEEWDDAHCYQYAAVQQSDPDKCDKVQPEGFPNSNPPRDKCYLKIAVKECDPSVCDRIVGGPMSYTVDGCQASVAQAIAAGDCPDSSDSESSRSSEEGESSSSSEETDIDDRECTFDDDCGAVCEGDTLRKRGCTFEYVCELTNFRTDCAEESASVETSEKTISVNHTCLENEGDALCGLDESDMLSMLTAEYQALRGEYDELQAAADDLNNLYQKASKACIDVLSDVTNKLIIDAAMAVKAPPKKMMDLLTNHTQDLINAGGSWATSDGNPTPAMPSSPEEKVALWCNLQRQITEVDRPLIDTKRDNLAEDIRILDAAIAQYE
jgi:hypothetical protein